MPNNDTQNVYSTPFNEGEAQPIPATRIGYDNTDSGLTSDDVQGAIDEIAGVKNMWAVKEWGYEEVAGDGTKTYQTILNEIATNMNAKLAALANDEKLVAIALTFGGTYTLPISPSTIFTNTDTFALQCDATVARSTSVVSYYSYVGSTDSVFRNASTSSNSTTFTDQSNTALASDKAIRLEYAIYKQV